MLVRHSYPATFIQKRYYPYKNGMYGNLYV
jgi:hypothetical protein